VGRNGRPNPEPAASDASTTRRWRVRDYSLAHTLDCGQAFRWSRVGEAWEGVVRGRWVRLREEAGSIVAETAEPQYDWSWLGDALQLHVDVQTILATFPPDPPLGEAVAACAGLRVLRQEPWECLASFMLSATKQIVQIRQIVATLCGRFGDPVAVPMGHAAAHAFPRPEQLAVLSEQELRDCKAGFRAPRLLGAARQVAEGRLDLERLGELPLEKARSRLMALDGVGRKIADCVLLFALGFDQVFPIDVWVLRALHELYFPRGRPKPAVLRHFSETHFGPYGGHAQQYLFHHLRTRGNRRPGVEPASINR
jgi:N-glycosylase/DNA lyase